MPYAGALDIERPEINPTWNPTQVVGYSAPSTCSMWEVTFYVDSGIFTENLLGRLTTGLEGGFHGLWMGMKVI